MRATVMTVGKAMYVANQLDKSWLHGVQHMLYTRSAEQPDYCFEKLWGLVTDPRNLRSAVERVARNKGRRTAGVDGITVRKLLEQGVDPFVAQLRADLRSGAYRPSPVRRVLIPKVGQPGKHRPLGIPTVKDRVVQAALKNILEPIFEADFYPTSHGFRPGKSAHGAIEHLRKLLLPRNAGPKAEVRLPYQWAVEGDIKGCFDNIDHHGLMERVRRRVGDSKVNRLVVAFLKAGILSEGTLSRSNAGTPQGGILSPLLANIALSVIDERYARWVLPRSRDGVTDLAMREKRGADARGGDRRRGHPVLVPIRYADDFIILVGAGRQPEIEAEALAQRERTELALLLREQLGLELSETKTLITSVKRPLRFLGHKIGVRPLRATGVLHCAVVIPKESTQRLRERIKAMFRRSTITTSLESRLKLLNSLLRGWANFYRYAHRAYRVFGAVDHYVWWTIQRWLRKKHRRAAMGELEARYGWRKPGRTELRWRDGGTDRFELTNVPTGRFHDGTLHPPHYAVNTYGEPSA